MEKVNELRLGNWIEEDYKEWDGKKWITRHVQFQIDKRQMLNILQGQTAFDFIPLTEQWLIDFNVKEIYIKENINITTSRLYLDSGNECTWDIDIEYVHTLQNLYFALTGKELIKNANSNTTKG